MRITLDTTSGIWCYQELVRNSPFLQGIMENQFLITFLKKLVLASQILCKQKLRLKQGEIIWSGVAAEAAHLSKVYYRVWFSVHLIKYNDHLYIHNYPTCEPLFQNNHIYTPKISIDFLISRSLSYMHRQILFLVVL